MPLALYLIAQVAFVSALAGLKSLPTSTLLVAGAVFQFTLVGWRLWNTGRMRWITVAPPLLTVGTWMLLTPWAEKETGGDGRGLVVGMATAVVCVLSYVGVAILAGCAPLMWRTKSNVL